MTNDTTNERVLGPHRPDVFERCRGCGAIWWFEYFWKSGRFGGLVCQKCGFTRRAPPRGDR